jgi:hypothetical protein
VFGWQPFWGCLWQGQWHRYDGFHNPENDWLCLVGNNCLDTEVVRCERQSEEACWWATRRRKIGQHAEETIGTRGRNNWPSLTMKVGWVLIKRVFRWCRWNRGCWAVGLTTMGRVGVPGLLIFWFLRWLFGLLMIQPVPGLRFRQSRSGQASAAAFRRPKTAKFEGPYVNELQCKGRGQGIARGVYPPPYIAWKAPLLGLCSRGDLVDWGDSYGDSILMHRSIQSPRAL